tara:strand:+ start:204 stop:1619 length:1416 start_codon:yes stop_codon:yes gene_type:complete
VSSNNRISRRDFGAIAAASGLGLIANSPIPAFAAPQKSIIWTGVNFIQDCATGKDLNCEAIDRSFPNLAPHFKDNKKKFFLYSKLPGTWGAAVGKSRQHKLVWTNEKAFAGDEVFKTDLAVILGITSDRTIATNYYPPPKDVTFMVYEVQSYLLVVDVKDFEIVQSYPIRILSIGKEAGKRTPIQIKEDLKSKMWRSLSGGDDKKAGSRRVPGELQRVLSSIDFDNLKKANVRVTKILSTSGAKKWIGKAHPQSAAIDQKTADKDFKFLLGNAATTAISEHFGIGIQPFTPNVSLGVVVRDWGMLSQKDQMVTQKLLNLGKIDLDIRVIVKGVRFTNQKQEGYKDVYLKKCVMVYEIQAGRYKRTFDDSGTIEQSAELIGEFILKQNLLAMSQEMTTGVFDNEWYWVLDMQQRLLDWFFLAIAKNRDLSSLTEGQRNRYEAREFLTRVYTKDFARFEREAKAFREALLTDR